MPAAAPPRDRRRGGARRRGQTHTPRAHAKQQKQSTKTKTCSLADATAKASKEFKEYAHCLDLTAGKYAYCRPEKAKFETAFPLLKEDE